MKKNLSILAIAILTMSFVLVGCGDKDNAGAVNDSPAGNATPDGTGGPKEATAGGAGSKAPPPSNAPTTG